jgi:hypothetical protein
VAAISAAQAIGRLKSSLDGRVLPPGIAAKGSRLLVRLSQTLRNPSVWKFGRRAREARALGRDPLVARGSAQPKELEALNRIVVGSATLGSELMRSRIIMQGKSNAIPI